MHHAPPRPRLVYDLTELSTDHLLQLLIYPLHSAKNADGHTAEGDRCLDVALKKRHSESQRRNVAVSQPPPHLVQMGDGR